MEETIPDKRSCEKKTSVDVHERWVADPEQREGEGGSSFGEGEISFSRRRGLVGFLQRSVGRKRGENHNLIMFMDEIRVWCRSLVRTFWHDFEESGRSGGRREKKSIKVPSRARPSVFHWLKDYSLV